MPDQRLRGGTDRPGQIEWTWVRDPDTGYEFDVQTKALREGTVPVDGVPLHYGPRPRKSKPLTDLAGNPTTPRPRATDTTDVGTAGTAPVVDDAPAVGGSDAGAVTDATATAHAPADGSGEPDPDAGTNVAATAASDDTGADSGTGNTTKGRRR
ncbi:MAG: hypothetical protein ABW022_16060 [Actinoplanes sp.]